MQRENHSARNRFSNRGIMQSIANDEKKKEYFCIDWQLANYNYAYEYLAASITGRHLEKSK